MVIFSSSSNRVKPNKAAYSLSRPAAHESMTPPSPAVKTGSRRNRRPPITIVNEKTGIRSEAVSNELIVRFKKVLSEEEIQTLIAKKGATVKTHVKVLKYYVLSLPSDLSVSEALRWFRQQDVVDQA